MPHGVQRSKESSGAGGCGSEVGMGDGVREWAGVQWWRGNEGVDTEDSCGSVPLSHEKERSMCLIVNSGEWTV